MTVVQDQKASQPAEHFTETLFVEFAHQACCEGRELTSFQSGKMGIEATPSLVCRSEYLVEGGDWIDSQYRSRVLGRFVHRLVVLL